MTLRRQAAIGAGEARTQGAPLAELRARLRTTHCAAERVVAAGRAQPLGALALAPLPRAAGYGQDEPAGTPDIEWGPTHTSTGFRTLDGLIGGLPRQGTVAIVGGPSSGVTTLTLRAVAEAQTAGAIAAWLDLPGRFDPLEAAERGVDLRWLVVVRPARSVDGLRIVGAMLASRSVDLLVLDLPPRMATDQSFFPVAASKPRALPETTATTPSTAHGAWLNPWRLNTLLPAALDRSKASLQASFR